MSILDRALDEIESAKRLVGYDYMIYDYDAKRIAMDVAAGYEAAVAREKARADAYEAVIKNLRLGITTTGREEEE